MRHKWADLIHLWAEGAEIQCNINEHSGDFGWLDDDEPQWHSENLKFRVKPKEPDWWENIPEHGVLCWVSDIDESTRDVIERIKVKNGWRYITPLTNEEIEEFKR